MGERETVRSSEENTLQEEPSAATFDAFVDTDDDEEKGVGGESFASKGIASFGVEMMMEGENDDDDDGVYEMAGLTASRSGSMRGSSKRKYAMTSMLQYPTKSIIGKVKRLYKSIKKYGGSGSSSGHHSRSGTPSSQDNLMNAGAGNSSGGGGGNDDGPSKQGFIKRNIHAAKVLFMGSKMNILLIALPLATMANPWALNWGDTVVFAFSLIALCPLAERLGFITEQIAMHTNDNIGGLLNATFGNATELIISIFALKEGLLRVVQLSLLGSVLSNMLLVLGSGLIAGGSKRTTQYFNRHAVMTSTGLLLMSLTSLILPSVLDLSDELRNGEDSLLWLSRFTSFAMLIAYGLYLFFTLKTHRKLMEEKGMPDDEQIKRTITNMSNSGTQMQIFASKISVAEKRRSGGSPGASAGGGGHLGNDNTPASEDDATTLEKESVFEDAGDLDDDRGTVTTESAMDIDTDDDDDDDEEDEEQVLGVVDGIVWLTIVTLLISLLSEWLVETIESSSVKWGVSMSFLSTIVLPIVGNAAEHASAIIFAYRNKLDLALGVAIGSSTQIAMFVIPACVLAGWAMGQDLSLNFNIFETTTMFATVLVVTIYCLDGQSNWLKGVVLLLCYIIIAASFWVHKDPQLAEEGGEGAAETIAEILAGPVAESDALDNVEGEGGRRRSLQMLYNTFVRR